MSMEQFKRAQVIMLPTEVFSESRPGYYQKVLNLNKSKFDKSLELFTTIDCILVPNPQHIYIISDDKIEEGDWYYTPSKRSIEQCVKQRLVIKGGDNDIAQLKIIATTDTSLHIQFVTPGNENLDVYEYTILPQPSQQFIEKYIESYNEGKVITDVMVEYEYIDCNGELIDPAKIQDRWAFIRLKVNIKDTTITIKKLKDSWNREAVIKLIKSFENVIENSIDSDDDGNTFTNVNLENWIEENL